jgi:hypothetical protein
VEAGAGNQNRFAEGDFAVPGQGSFPQRLGQVPQLRLAEGALQEGQGSGLGKGPGAAQAGGKEETALAPEGSRRVGVGHKNYKMKRIMSFHLRRFHGTITAIIRACSKIEVLGQPHLTRKNDEI